MFKKLCWRSSGAASRCSFRKLEITSGSMAIICFGFVVVCAHVNDLIAFKSNILDGTKCEIISNKDLHTEPYGS
jgi:hypothetical protein